MVWLPVLGIFNVRTDVVDARDCTLGLYGHRKRVCTGSGLWEKNPLWHRGLEPASVLRRTYQLDVLPTELFPAPHLIGPFVVFVVLAGEGSC